MMRHWVFERRSSIRLIPLVVFLFYGFVESTSFVWLRDHAGSFAWLLSLAIVLVLFYHLFVGAESLVRDYVHTGILTAVCRSVLARVVICRAKDTRILLVDALS